MERASALRGSPGFSEVNYSTEFRKYTDRSMLEGQVQAEVEGVGSVAWRLDVFSEDEKWKVLRSVDINAAGWADCFPLESKEYASADGLMSALPALARELLQTAVPTQR